MKGKPDRGDRQFGQVQHDETTSSLICCSSSLSGIPHWGLSFCPSSLTLFTRLSSISTAATGHCCAVLTYTGQYIRRAFTSLSQGMCPLPPSLPVLPVASWLKSSASSTLKMMAWRSCLLTVILAASPSLLCSAGADDDVAVVSLSEVPRRVSRSPSAVFAFRVMQSSGVPCVGCAVTCKVSFFFFFFYLVTIHSM
jgi:hypothetical protein